MAGTDVIVLGAGMVGVSTALHLQKRGKCVVLIDRRGAGEETSYGNTGIIQREGVVPYPFPRNIALMAQYAVNARTEANLHWSAIPNRSTPSGSSGAATSRSETSPEPSSGFARSCAWNRSASAPGSTWRGR